LLLRKLKTARNDIAFRLEFCKNADNPAHGF
jgi:hypothetical protein